MRPNRGRRKVENDNNNHNNHSNNKKKQLKLKVRKKTYRMKPAVMALQLLRLGSLTRSACSPTPTTPPRGKRFRNIHEKYCKQTQGRWVRGRGEYEKARRFILFFIIPRHISRARFSLFLKQLRYSCFQPYILLYFLFFPKPRGVQRSRVWFSGALGRGSLSCRTTCIFSVYHETCLVGTDGFFFY